MEVVVGKFAGFCPGVAVTIEKAEKELDKNTRLYCLGEIVHNAQVIENLEQKGMKTIKSIDELTNGDSVIFRAHGEAKKIYEIAEDKKLKVIDLTCGNVKSIHKKVEKEKDKSFIIILGKRTHPEVIGTKGFAGENSYVIQTEDDILDAYMEYEKTNLGRVYVVAQTTFSSNYFDKLTQEIKINFIEADVVIDKTICSATELRQKETEEMSKIFHKMIIIGGKNSANTKELAEIAKKNCKAVYCIQTVEDLKNINITNTGKIGIMAGASTPKDVILEVKKYIENNN